MTPDLILTHLYTYLPKYTDLFHKEIPGVTSVVALANNTIEVVTSAAHGLLLGDIVGMNDSLVPTVITGVRYVTDSITNVTTIEILTGTTTDLTGEYHTTVTLGGFANPAMNGVQTISEVYSPTQFDLVVPAGLAIDLVVTGGATTLCVGNYYEDGNYNSVMSYKGTTYYSWFDGTNYIISSAKGSKTGAYWTSSGSSAFGSYAPTSPALGTATATQPAAYNTLTGAQYVYSKRELLDGMFNITAVPTDTSFRFVVPDNIPTGTLINATLFAHIRIYFSVSAEDAKRPYTKQDSTIVGEGPYLVVVMGDERASKDPTMTSEAVNMNRGTRLARQLYTQAFFVLVVLDSTKSESGITPQNLIYSEIRSALRRVFHNYAFTATDDFSVVYATVEVGNDMYYYDSAVYMHAFEYQIPYEITLEQGFNESPSVSLENVSGNLYIHPRELTDAINENGLLPIDANIL